MGLLIVREGEGEQEAMPALVYRLATHLALDLPYNAPKDNWRKPLVTEAHVSGVCEMARALPGCEGLLLTRDADVPDQPDADCPKFVAPEVARWLRDLSLTFPVALVLFYKEFESLFLAGAEGMAGREVTDARGRVLVTIPAGVAAHPVPETPRDAKGWVRSNLVAGYKPTLYQAPLTRLLDFDDRHLKALPSFLRLVSALRFLAAHRGKEGAVYPNG